MEELDGLLKYQGWGTLVQLPAWHFECYINYREDGTPIEPRFSIREIEPLERDPRALKR